MSNMIDRHQPRSYLLTRDKFREAVFARDEYLCVYCRAKGLKVPAVDAHHIIERRLFTNGGYFLDNGASVCGPCHLAAEATVISCDDLRRAAGITRGVLPDHLYTDQDYDKWGNPILPSGMRLKGELFHDPSVQKVLEPVLQLFTDKVKYPRTYHLPWSPGLTNDDRKLESLDAFEGQRVVVMVKMDGENTTMYRDYIHARSLEFSPHPSRNRVKTLHGTIAHEIPEGWRVCGENLYAKHSILYKNLPDYYLMFSVWNDRNVCLSWDETKEWADLLGLATVPVIYDGIWDEATIQGLYTPEFNGDECEGYVVRVASEFHYKDFRRCVGKYVRKDHVVQHGGHWANRQVVSNEVRGEK